MLVIIQIGIFPKFLSYKAIPEEVKTFFIYRDGKAILMLSHILSYFIFKVNSEGLFMVTFGVFLLTKLSSEGPWESCAVYIIKASTWLRAEVLHKFST